MNDAARPAAWQSIAALTASALLVSTVLVVVDHFSRPRIEAEQRAAAEALLAQMLPSIPYDNALAASFTALEPGPGGGPTGVYRARHDGHLAALIYTVTSEQGYGGTIDLLVGVDPTGRITAVRVASHRETPGLGDQIEAQKSDWIAQFAGRRLGDPPAAAWRPNRLGGAFKTISGATVTSAAVSTAVRQVLEYDAAHRADLPAAEPPQ